MHPKSTYTKFFQKLIVILLLLSSTVAQGQLEVEELEEEIDSITYFNVIDKARLQPVQERTIPDSMINALKGDEAFWYANKEFKKPEVKKQSTSPWFMWLQQAWLRNLLWFLIAGTFIAVLIWYLSSLDVQLFRKKPATINQLHDDELPQDIFSIPYESEIEKAINNSNYRLAVRLLYLQLLTHMSHKGVIQYKQDKTNSEYLMQLAHTAIYKDFFRLTRNFEYTWYGQFKISQPAFEVMRNDFYQFNQRLTS